MESNCEGHKRTQWECPAASCLRGVDLNSRAALILRKLLILQYATVAQLAEKANLSYTFLTHYSGSFCMHATSLRSTC